MAGIGYGIYKHQVYKAMETQYRAVQEREAAARNVKLAELRKEYEARQAEAFKHLAKLLGLDSDEGKDKDEKEK